jgi:hypothetical protein
MEYNAQLTARIAKERAASKQRIATLRQNAKEVILRKKEIDSTKEKQLKELEDRQKEMDNR